MEDHAVVTLTTKAMGKLKTCAIVPGDINSLMISLNVFRRLLQICKVLFQKTQKHLEASRVFRTNKSGIEGF